ncbi:hypothetical protein MNB_SV-15-1530 [hydrothermal vent metagenome]|uniref:Uncharacterized protein n=1 Tax=hydrothermal vent metagenome TaxID=652676 RepID=A0A1W1EK63_9ZZZZ
MVLSPDRVTPNEYMPLVCFEIKAGEVGTLTSIATNPFALSAINILVLSEDSFNLHALSPEG